MIKTKNLKVLYPDLIIEYNDYTFKENSITFIKGMNGSGKTSFLKSLATLHPYQGTISGNHNITYNSPKPVMFNMNVMDNIMYPLRIRRQDDEPNRQRAIEYTKKMGLFPLLNKNAHKLSDGEQKKTSIVRSIIFNPDILLLDEPTSSLDVESIVELTTVLKELKQSMTIIIVSHDRAFIDELQDDVIELGGNYVSSKDTE